MKRPSHPLSFCWFSLLPVSLPPSSAQKYAYVNTQYILDNIPDYKMPSSNWTTFRFNGKKEIEDKYAIIMKLYKAYQAEQVLLTEEMKNVARMKSLRRKRTLKIYRNNVLVTKAIFSRKTGNGKTHSG